MKIYEIIENVYNLIWGIPLVSLILIVGIIYTIKLKCLQISKLPKAISFLITKKDNNKKGVTSFQALCISLSATIGTGNIVGVASSIVIGGPGALFWMVVSAFLGMAIKYAEGFLAIRYRKKETDYIIGGPYAYIEYGMGKKYKWLAKSFAIFGMCASILGLGTFIQVKGIVDASLNVFDKSTLNFMNIFGYDVSIIKLIVGLVLLIICSIVIFGGIKKIATTCEKLVPFMTILYILMCLIVIISNVNILPSAFLKIITGAFNFKSIIGGVAGYTIVNAIKQGVSKGIFTNEAGLGSAPIAISESSSNNPIKEGLITMTSTFFGTIIICTLTGLCIIMTDAYLKELDSIYVVDYAFFKGSFFSNITTSIFILIATICFGITSIIGWNLYGVKCLRYLTNNETIIKGYKIIYVIFIFTGVFLNTKFIWNIAEIFNALMAIPNLIALIYLKNDVIKETNEYLLKNKKGKI